MVGGFEAGGVDYVSKPMSTGGSARPGAHASAYEQDDSET